MFLKLKIVVIGDIILDEYLTVQNYDFCREDCDRFIVKDKQYYLGGAANVAAVLSNYGANVTLIGGVGSDVDYQILRKLFINFSISTDYLSINKELSTNKKTRLMDFTDKKRCLARFDIQDPNRYKYAYYQNGILDAINKCDVIIISDYNLGFLEHYSNAKKLLEEVNKPIFVDQKVNFNQYNNAVLISPNEEEYSLYCDKLDIPYDIHSISNYSKLFEYNKKLQFGLLKLGSKGCRLIEKNLNTLESNLSRKLDIDVRSTVGAGDCVLATFVMAYLSKMSLSECLELADMAGCVKVMNYGTYQPTLDDLLQMQKKVFELEI